MYYIRFIVCLAVGLTGLCMVLKTLLDTLFVDWDVVEDIRLSLERPSFFKEHFVRLEDEIIEAEPPKLATRIDFGSRRAD